MLPPLLLPGTSPLGICSGPYITLCFSLTCLSFNQECLNDLQHRWHGNGCSSAMKNIGIVNHCCYLHLPRSKPTWKPQVSNSKYSLKFWTQFVYDEPSYCKGTVIPPFTVPRFTRSLNLLGLNSIPRKEALCVNQCKITPNLLCLSIYRA